MSEQGRPGRYQRSFDGLVGALIITVLAVLAFVVFRGLFSKDVEAQSRPPAVDDYLAAVSALQGSGAELVYPPTLPEGWTVTDVRPEQGEREGLLSYKINLYTADDAFVGIRQGFVDADDLVTQYVDEDATGDDPLTGVGDVSRTWQGWQDDGGDHGFSTTVGDQSVLVFGDVSADELAELVALLTTEAVSPEAGS